MKKLKKCPGCDHSVFETTGVIPVKKTINVETGEVRLEYDPEKFEQWTEYLCVFCDSYFSEKELLVEEEPEVVEAEVIEDKEVN